MLRVENLSKTFSSPRGEVLALDDVSLELRAGQFQGITGESGAGKSTLAMCILGVEKPSKGRVLFQSQEVAAMDQAQRRKLWRQIQIIWQEPGLALNPHMRVERIVAEPLLNYDSMPKNRLRHKVRTLLSEVELDPSLGGRYPHQLSGGQTQRVCIARALALEPRLLICDEPVSALDLPMQLKIMELLEGLRRQLGLTVLLVTHDLGIALRYCGQVTIMRHGQVVEQGPASQVLRRPSHPYAKRLLAATPRLPWSG